MPPCQELRIPLSVYHSLSVARLSRRFVRVLLFLGVWIGGYASYVCSVIDFCEIDDAFDR